MKSTIKWLHFKNSEILPWEGCTYQNAPVKLLILGESHYRRSGDSRPVTDTTKNAVGEAVQSYKKGGGFPGSFWRALHNLLAPAMHIEPGTSIWDHVLFANYVQGSVGLKARERPTDQDWVSKETQLAFRELIEVGRPDKMLVVGKTNWQHLIGSKYFSKEDRPESLLDFRLPNKFCAGIAACDHHAYRYKSGGHAVVCAPIFHPSYPSGFYFPNTKDSDTENVVRQLLSY